MRVKLLFAVIFVFQLGFSQTSVPGGVVSGIWTLAGSPYNVQGSIQIVNGDSLIIQPGVTVNFQGTYKFLVLGKLKAIGTITDSITFTAANITTGWRGIRFSNTNASNDTSRIVYCKLQYGKATGASPDNNGGALYFDNVSKVVISHSRIIYCFASGSGGGIYINSGSPVISNNTISNDSLGSGGMLTGCGIFMSLCNSSITNNLISHNAAPSSCDGGGIYIASGNPIISNNTISSNSYYGYGKGGGICIENGSALITNNIISNNKSSNGAGIQVDNGNGTPIISGNTVSGNIAQNVGGGIEIYSNVTISNNQIFNNTAASAGAGIECYTSTATIKNNFICNNTVSPTTWQYLGGGGIWCVNCSSFTLIYDNIIVNNTATNGAGLLCYNASPTFTNNTIVNNSASGNGGALSCSGGSPILRNCIVYGNTAVTSGAQVYLDDESSDPAFYYCNVEGSSSAFEVNGNFYTGSYQNNINALPQFVSPSAGSGTGFNGLLSNWALQITSPCIETGDPGGTYPATDIAGNPRVVGVIDMGAYEDQSASGVDNLSLNSFSFYPNPSTGQITIQSSEKISKIGVVNILGETIYQSVGSTSNQSSIDLSSQPAGIYSLQITSTRGTEVRKLVIRK